MDYLTWEERCRMYPVRFNVLDDCKTEAFDMSRVHPLKQREVLKIYNTLSGVDKVESVVVFGSALSMKCNIESDLDLVITVTNTCTDIQRNNIDILIQEATDWDCDILWGDHIDLTDRIYEDVERGLKLI